MRGVGAELGEVSTERSTHRNGYHPRPWETRVGEIDLLVPRKRHGAAYFPSFLEPRRRSEQAIVASVLEAYVNGVSTRKVDRLVEQLGVEGMTKDRVSALCKGLDEQVEAFRERPLEGEHPYLWLDAKHVNPALAATCAPRRQGCAQLASYPRDGHARAGDRARLALSDKGPSIKWWFGSNSFPRSRWAVGSQLSLGARRRTPCRSELSRLLTSLWAVQSARVKLEPCRDRTGRAAGARDLEGLAERKDVPGRDQPFACDGRLGRVALAA